MLRSRVVARGIDTLVLFTAAPVRADVVAQLEALKQRARDCREGQPWEPVPGLELQVQSHGVGGARFLATSDLFALRLNPEPGDDNTPTVTIEVRALGLWSLGWRRAGDRTEEMLRACTLASAPLMTQVSRVDLAVDFQGWVPEPGDRVRLHSRARKRARHWVEDPLGWHWLDNDAGRAWLAAEVDRQISLVEQLKKAKASKDISRQRELVRAVLHADDTHHAEYDDGRHFTGFSIGAGAMLSARIYDKRRECETRRKTWFEGVWKKSADYVPEASVWRLEFQLRREGLRSMRLEHTEGEFTPGSWESLKANVGSIWRYMSRRWLWHGTRSAEVRQGYSEQWVPLTDTAGWSDEEEILPLHRAAAEGQSEGITAGLAGYLTSAAALVAEAMPGDVAPDFGEVMVSVMAAAFAHVQRVEQLEGDEGETGLEKRYHEKVCRLRARRVDGQSRKPADLRGAWLERNKEGLSPTQWVRYGFHPLGPQTAALGGVVLRFDGQAEDAFERARRAFDHDVRRKRTEK